MPEPRMGPQGFHYYIPPPECKMVDTGKAPTFYMNGKSPVPSQQYVPVGGPCYGTVVIDHIPYGRIEPNGILYAICQVKK